MEIRNWVYLIGVIVLILLIFNFLSSIFKSDVKRFSQDRIYVDFNAYKKPSTTSSTSTSSNFSPVFYQQVELGKKYVNAGRMEFSSSMYTDYMSSALGSCTQPPVEAPSHNEPFDKYIQLANKNIEQLAYAKALFAQKNFPMALEELNALLAKMDRNDLQHRLQVYDCIAECHFQQKNRDGYVENKVNYVKTMRQIKELVRKAYSNAPEEKSQDWVTSEEATQQLLRIRIMANEKLQGPERDIVIRRAEFDLEVARRLSSCSIVSRID